MPVIKKSEVTPEMMEKAPLRVHDIGAGAKILILSPIINGAAMTCLERDGVRTNFAMSRVQDMHGHKYIQKHDGVHENGVPFTRCVNVDDMIRRSARAKTHHRVRNASEVISDVNNG